MKKRVVALILTGAMSLGQNVYATEIISSGQTDVIEEADSYVEGDEIIVELEGDSVSEETEIDNEELFEEFIEEQFSETAETLDSKPRGDYLVGTNLIVYNKLKAEISKVANGELDSTQFTFTLEDLGVEDKLWTAEELGVDAIVEDGYITEAASAAVSAQVDIDLNKILSALLLDCPYELYWYDKVAGSSSHGPEVSASYDGIEWTIGLASGITISLSVSQGYAAGQYLVDTTNAERVKTAVKKANEIVNKYASNSDYEKLMAYKNEICNLVAYDHNTANDESTPYGDSWQMVSVFDGDDSTNVVCEGYSKAFQYLCDQTSFRKDISCVSVTGMMTGGTGAGSHMWNIVTMEDGKNYIVDVTNCDTGTIGADNQLFLAACIGGDIESGYTYCCTGGNMHYAYDKDTIAIYSEEDLQISVENYEIKPEEEPIKDETGFRQGSDGNWYYYRDNVLQTKADVISGSVEGITDWWYVDNTGKVTTSFTGMTKSSELGWVYVKDGIFDQTFTGMAKNTKGWWYIKDGKLDLTYTGIAQNTKGHWYMINGKLDTSVNGMVKVPTYGWIYLEKGKWAVNYTGMAKNKYGWWYIRNGKLDQTYTGIAQNKNGFWYMINGKLDNSVSGMVKVTTYGWIYLAKGKWDTSYTGMAKNKYGWWYIKDGKLDQTFTGIAQNSHGLWYMVNGKLANTFNGNVTYQFETYLVENGKATLL